MHNLYPFYSRRPSFFAIVFGCGSRDPISIFEAKLATVSLVFPTNFLELRLFLNLWAVLSQEGRGL